MHAEALTREYEALQAAEVQAWLEPFLPSAPALIADVGAGVGRDAARLASQGHQVLAVEPSAGMRRQGQRLHPDNRIRWLDDRLPALATTLRRARDGVLGWWSIAYLAADNAALPRRFADEARASLPGMGPVEVVPDLDEVYAAVGLQRLRLHQDQQAPEWTG